MDSRAISATEHSFCLPQSSDDGHAVVVVTRAGAEPVVHPFKTKEEACFWARQWMRRERLAALERLVFGSDWILVPSHH